MKEAGRLFKEGMAENFPNLLKNINLYVKETHCAPNRISPKCLTLRHVIVKFTKVRELLRATRKK